MHPHTLPHRWTRRAFLEASWLATAAAPWIGRGGESAPARPDDDWLAEARERIQRRRRGRGVVAVRTAAGQPVAGARVRVRQKTHEFLFGCNCFMVGRVGNAELEAAYRERFAGLLNFATLGFYWATYERERGRPDYEYTDRVLEWARGQGIRGKGHPLVWDHRAGAPRWLPADDAELAALSNGRVSEIVGRFKGRLEVWDVVNEATHLPDHVNQTRMAAWGEKLGPVPYTAEPLRLARAANPSATLVVNDYRIEPRYYALLDALRVDGRLAFDAVGLQSHMHDGGWPLRRIWEVCDTYARLGLPLHFTETTVVSGPRLGPGENWGSTTPELEERQAAYVEKFYTMLFAHPGVQALTWWDFSDRGAWQRAAAGLVRTDMSPKPAYDRLHALIKKAWWTNVEGTTDETGVFGTEAVFGQHEIHVTTPAGREVKREVHWARGAENRFEILV